MTGRKLLFASASGGDSQSLAAIDRYKKLRSGSQVISGLVVNYDGDP
jgi:hypothetical protein